MNTSNQPRRTVAGPDVKVGVRPGAGVLGLARPETAVKAGPGGDPTSEGSLIVGDGICVKGEIDSCNTLVVEGKVEASLEAVVLTIRKGGLYNGKAVVKSASIDGRFDGDLTVDGLLTIEAGGRVSGTLRYREIKINEGGRLSGDIDLMAQENARTSEAATAGNGSEAQLVKASRASR